MAARLTHADKRRIEERIAAVEARTAGELVVVLVDRSDAYDLPRAAAAGLATLFAAAILHLIAPALHMTWVIVLEAPIALGAWFVLGTTPLLRSLVPAQAMETAVHARAALEFLERDVHATRGRSGVLILVSRLERRVVILADSGIHEKVQAAGWQKEVAEIVTGIRRGDVTTAILQAIERLGAILAHYFPARPDDTNELPNRVDERT